MEKLTSMEWALISEAVQKQIDYFAAQRDRAESRGAREALRWKDRIDTLKRASSKIR